MWLPREERHFAVTLLIAGLGTVIGAVGLVYLLPLVFLLRYAPAETVEFIIAPSVWLVASVGAVLVAALLFWRVWKRGRTTPRADEPQAGNVSLTVLTGVTGAALAAIGLSLLAIGVAVSVAFPRSGGHGPGPELVAVLALFFGTCFAVPGILLLVCAWVRRPTKVKPLTPSSWRRRLDQTFQAMPKPPSE